MKDLFSGMLKNTREVKGRIAVYDERLIFGEKLNSFIVPENSPVSLHTFSIGVAEDGYIYSFIRSLGGEIIYYTRRNDENQIPTWAPIGSICYFNSPVTSYGDTVFYFNKDQQLVKSKYPFTSETVLAQPGYSFDNWNGWSSVEYRQLSAVSDDEVFCFARIQDDQPPYYSIGKIVFASSTAQYEWQGRFYDKQLTTLSPFSAIKLNGTSYIYISDLSQFRTYYLKEKGGLFSELGTVVPMDVLDDLSMFYMSSASVIGDKAVLTGRLRRPDTESEMLVYLIGPDEFTFGRDMFIEVPFYENPIYDHNAKLYAFNNKLIFQAADYKYIANGTTLLGNNNMTLIDGIPMPEIGQHINKVLSMTIGAGISSPGTAQIDISPNDIVGGLPALRPGTVIRPELFINDGTVNQWFSLGEYEIDGAIDPFEDNERTITVSLRQKAIRRLAQWTCDAPFDYWSQTKLTTNPKQLTDVIRVNGHWDDNGEDLKITELNEDNYFYVNARPGKNTDVEAIFNLYELTNTDVRVGVCVNFFTETRAQAAERMGVESSTVVASDLNKYSIMFWYDPRIDQAGIDHIGDDSTESVFPVSIATQPGERCLLRVSFVDGRLCCYLVPNFSYNTPVNFDAVDIKIFDYLVEKRDDMPWHRAELVEGDELGRGAVYMRSSTAYSKVYPFASTDDYVPVQGTPFPDANATVKVGSEILTYGAKTNLTPFTTELDFAVGITLASMDGTINTDQPFADLRSRNYIRQEFVIPAEKYVSNSTYCTGLSIKAKKNFFPQDGLNLMLYDRNITAYNPLGSRKASKIIQSENIGEDYDWITVVFNSPVLLSQSNDHIICCRGEDAANPNSQAFYTAGLVSGNAYTGGRFFTFSDDNDTFTQIVDKDIPFKVYGTYDPPGGNYVVRVTNVAGLSTTTDYYKNMALYVTDGPGKGSTYLISGYVYGAEVCTFYLKRNPSALGLGSKFIIVNTLYNVVRSNPIAHRLDEKIDLYYPGPYVGCEKVTYFTSEQDKKLSDIARSIVRKAGVLGFSERYLVNGNFVPSTGAVLDTSLKNVILEVVIPHDMNDTAVLSFRNGAVSVSVEPPSQLGALVSIYQNGIWYRTFAADRIQDKPMVISVNDNFISFWSMGRYLFAFPISETETMEAGIALSGPAATPINIKISELSYRVDNFLLDTGTTGLQLLDRLINNKIYYYMDDGNGGIKMFRSRTEVNDALNPYKLAVATGRTDTDVSVFSRIRVEGAEAKEVIDIGLMKEYGNIYKTVNIDEINNIDDAEYFSSALIEDAKDKAEIISLVGSADIRLEPMDIIYARILKRGGGYEDKKIIIDDITIRYEQSNEVQFDMNITGRVDR